MRLILLLCAVVAYAQTPSATGSTGLEPAWDIAVIVQEIGANAAALGPALDKVDAKGWMAKGAPDAYAQQLDSSKQQARAIADGASALAKNPEKLSASLELFFRMESLETMLGSIEDGIRKYQGAALAQSLAALYAEGGANRQRFRQYIVNLATQREQQFEVMDREAQRCRATFNAPPPPPKTGRKK